MYDSKWKQNKITEFFLKKRIMIFAQCPSYLKSTIWRKIVLFKVA